jgi:proteasome beta subunit
MDENGARLFSVDAMGGASREEEMVATGSGSPMAFGVLEDRYKKDMNEDEAVSLAVRAVRSAMKRDAGSGEGIHVVVITQDAYREIGDQEVREHFPALPA